MTWPRKCGPSARQLRRDGSAWKTHAPLRVATSTAVRCVVFDGARGIALLAVLRRVVADRGLVAMSPPCFRNGTATIGGSAAAVIGLRRIRDLDGWITLATQRFGAATCKCAERADRVGAAPRPAIGPSTSAQPQADDSDRGHEGGEHR